MSTPYVLFCGDPLSPRKVDPAYAGEADAARNAGFEIIVLDHDELDIRTDADAALRRVPASLSGTVIYRGWMLKADAYMALHDALASRGLAMITSPGQYEACHHAPASYPALAGWLPQAVFTDIDITRQPGTLSEALLVFGSSPLILKDWVKSQASGYWKEACYIPDAAKTEEATRVVDRFIELQGDSLTGGLVFKKFIELEPPGDVPFEHRAFIADGKAIGCWPRSVEARELGPPPSSIVEAVAMKVPGRFVSADFGRGTDGKWQLLEIGDGQVSGLPEAADPIKFYSALFGLLTGACWNP